MPRDTIVRIVNPPDGFGGECRVSHRGCIAHVRVADTVLTDGRLELSLMRFVDDVEPFWKKDFGIVCGGNFRTPLPVKRLGFGYSYILTARFFHELYNASDSVRFHYIGKYGQPREPLPVEARAFLKGRF